jgi:hypothetical protein
MKFGFGIDLKGKKYWHENRNTNIYRMNFKKN